MATTTKKRKKRKPFWKDIKFKYRLTITNENTLEEVASLYVSKLNGISILLFVLLGLFLVAALIVSFCVLHPPAQLPARLYEQRGARTGGEQRPARRLAPTSVGTPEPLRDEHPGHLPRRRQDRHRAEHGLAHPAARRLPDGTHPARGRFPQEIRGSREIQPDQHRRPHRCRRTHLLPAHTRPGVRPLRCRGQARC